MLVGDHGCDPMVPRIAMMQALQRGGDGGNRTKTETRQSLQGRSVMKRPAISRG